MCEKNSRSPYPEKVGLPATPNDSQAGFSFIEVLIAISLLSILVVGVLSMNSAYIKFNRSNKFYATAVQLAENGIEACMQMPYANLSGLSDTKDFGQIPGFLNYTRTIAVENYNTINCTIRARAAWREGSKTNAAAGRWPIEITVVRTSL